MEIDQNLQQSTNNHLTHNSHPITSQEENWTKPRSVKASIDQRSQSLQVKQWNKTRIQSISQTLKALNHINQALSTREIEKDRGTEDLHQC